MALESSRAHGLTPNTSDDSSLMGQLHRSHPCETPVLDSNLDSHGIIQGCRKAEVEAISGAEWLALRGPADHDELLAVHAFDFDPQTAIARRVRSIDAL